MRYDSNTGDTIPDLPHAEAVIGGAAKGTTPASDITATAIDANHTALDVQLPGPVALAPSTTVTANQGTAGAAAWPVSVATVPSHPVTQGTSPWVVSASSLPLPTGAATDASLASLLARLPASLVGGRLDVNLGAPATLPVSGTFWQATQPVSGTFWQATQPVSLATNTPDVTDRSARLLGHVTVDNASIPVTGTFFQATQPVSAAALPLPAGAAQEHATAASPHAVRPTDGTAFYDTRTTNNGLQSVLLSWEEMAGTAAVESTLTNSTFQTQNLVALTAATSYTVPAGKRFRVTNVSCYVKATSTVNNLARLRIRAVAAAPVANTSPPVFDTVLSLAAPGTIAAGLMQTQAYSIPEGSLDFPAAAQLTFTWNTAANTCTVGMTIVGYLYTP